MKCNGSPTESVVRGVITFCLSKLLLCARVFLCFILIYSYSCFFAPHQLSDSGIYTCVATSSSGETSWSAFLEVKGETRLYDCKNARERTFILCFCEDRDLFLQSFQNQAE